MSNSNNNSNHSASNEIPQFVVIRDQVHSTYKHPIVHYVFEDEPFPEVPKENLIMVDMDEQAQLDQVESYSPHFQVTNCRLDHNSTVYDQFEGDHDGSGFMTIEGVSAPRAYVTLFLFFCCYWPLFFFFYQVDGICLLTHSKMQYFNLSTNIEAKQSTVYNQ